MKRWWLLGLIIILIAVLGIISFNLNGIHGHDVSELLNRKRIAIRAGHSCAIPLISQLGIKGGVCRVSFSIYNTFEDIDKLVKTLKKINKRFNKK